MLFEDPIEEFGFDDPFVIGIPEDSESTSHKLKGEISEHDLKSEYRFGVLSLA